MGEGGGGERSCEGYVGRTDKERTEGKYRDVKVGGLLAVRWRCDLNFPCLAGCCCAPSSPCEKQLPSTEPAGPLPGNTGTA